MNLRIDLILENEKRSASILNAKSLIRIGIIVVPCIIVLIGMVGSINVMRSKSESKRLSQTWDILEGKQAEAKSLRNETAINNNIKEELWGWKASQMDWYTPLVNLQRVAPLNMQFTRLKINQTLQLVKNKYPARHYTLTLNGKAKGADAEANINKFVATVKASDVFTEMMESVSINHFGEDKDETASRQDRVFEIECIFKPKEFREPRKK